MPYFAITRRYLLVSVIAILIFNGCGVFESDTNNLNESVQFDLKIDKNELGPGEQFTALYTARNFSNKNIKLATSCIGFAIIGVYKDGENAHFNGADTGCYTGLGSFEIGPKESLQFEWDINAFTLSREIGQSNFDTTLVAPGNYKLRVYSNVVGLNGKDFVVEPEEVDFKIQ